MAVSKEDKALFLSIAQDKENFNIEERRKFAEMIDYTIEEDKGKKVEEVKETAFLSSDVKKPKAKKAKKVKKAKKKKMTKEEESTAKSAIKKHTGKTEEECEEILERYKASQKKAKARASKLKKQGKTIKGTDEKTAAAVVDTAATKVGKKIKKEVKKAKTPAKKAATIDKIVKNAIAESKKLIKNLSTTISKEDKSDAKVYLLAMRKQIDTLLKKYGDGGMVQPLNIQEGLISVGNNTTYAHGGSTQGYDDRLDESLGMRRGWGYGKKQSYKDRRDESKGMLKARAHRAYSGVGTMDEEAWDRGWKMEKGGKVKVQHYGDTLHDFDVKDKKEAAARIEKLLNRYNKTRNKTSNYAIYYEDDNGEITSWQKFGKGGKAQGYDDRQDESLGMRRGKQSSKKVSAKGRRDDSYGKWGKRDKEAKKRLEEYQVASDNINHFNRQNEFIMVDGKVVMNDVTKMPEYKILNKKFQESLKKVKEMGYAHGGSTQGYDDRQDESLGMRRGKQSSKKVSARGRRDDSYGKWGKRGSEHRDISMKKGGWVQEVVDSPKFRTGAFTKKAEKRGLTPEQFMRKVLANPHYYDERTRRQAQFMENIGD